MPAIRLAVSHTDEGEVAAIAARLRGATVEPFRGTSEGCDAVMLLGPADHSTADKIRAVRVSVLAVADVCTPSEVRKGLFGLAEKVRVRFAVVNPDRYLPSRQLIRKQLTLPLGEPGGRGLERRNVIYWPSGPGSESVSIPLEEWL